MSTVQIANPKDVYIEEEKSAAVLSTENRKLQKKLKQTQQLVLVSLILLVCAIGGIVAVLIYHSIESDTPDDDEPRKCGLPPPGTTWPRIYLNEPDAPSPFHDVTVKEIRRIQGYLKETGILTVTPKDATFRDSHIYTIDLEPPNKLEVLNHTDNGADAPERYARVFLFRGDMSEPVVEERLCGPLNNISSCRVSHTRPFAYRPIESKEYVAYEEKLLPDIQQELGDILRESFGGSFDYKNCETNCFNWWAALLSSKVYGEINVRKMWLTPMYDLPYYSVFPVDISFLCNVNGTDPMQFHVEQVWYAGELFDTVQILKEKYANDTINKIRQTHPTEEEAQFATLTWRGSPKPSRRLRPPELIEPDGRRYSIYHKRVEYLDMWSFYIRNSPIYGPALYDIRFLGDRVIYELSLQELSTTLSGSSSPTRLQFFLDSFFLMGSKAKALVPGADCPKIATFLPLTIPSQDREEPAVFKRAVCIFEQNKGTPLRRHHSYSQDEKTFYGGMLDSALVVRSIHTVDNVDRIIDFTFHQNGAVAVAVTSSGYLAGSAWAAGETPYGRRIHDFLFGPMYHSVAHFKVDLDIGGSTANRYETINIKEETVTLRETNPAKTFSQTRSEYNLKATEMDAAYALDFDQPVQHIFHNNALKNKHGGRRAYRIINQSPSKTLVTAGVGPEPSVPWARYQLAVTKRKEEEQRSSAQYSQYDALNPAVDFQRFIADNEAIVDEDIVAWVTIGGHHIPTSEDLPILSTVGRTESFYVMPSNYFPECPSMASRDAVHIDEKNPEEPMDGLTFDFHGTGDVSNEDLGGACTTKPFDMTLLWKNDPDELFEINYNKGVY